MPSPGPEGSFHPLPNEIHSQHSPDKPHKNQRFGTSLNHHQIRCTVCHHPDCAAIEQDFLHWVRPGEITREFDLGDRRAIGRHARALGLFEIRAAKTKDALAYIMEQAETVTATAGDIIKAVRAYSCIDENGRWHEPTRRTIITHETRTIPADRATANRPVPRHAPPER
ncbi:MAG TPA: hypothetical protein VMF66_16035 [Candidatus Acidoferrum sp.]|nr:hypothetical protein [Candidatus Acidoferrum sp.]